MAGIREKINVRSECEKRVYVRKARINHIGLWENPSEQTCDYQKNDNDNISHQ